MRHAKIGHVHQNFWHGILVCLIVVCPLFAEANQHDMQPEIQKTTDKQNSPQVTRQDVRDITAIPIEQQEILTTRPTIYMVILGILFLVILIFFISLLFQYRILVSELNDIKNRIGMFSNVNSNLKRDLSEINNRIQKFAIISDKISDIEKLATEKQDSTRKILNLLKPKELESSEQVANNTTAPELPPAIVELCKRYNAGIQDEKKQNDFLQHYHSPYKIYVENSMDRRVKQQTKPIFKTHHAAGDFLGCYVEEGKLYAVVPAYRLKIVHAILHYGAFVDVFECHEHEFDDSDSCYEVVKIIKPAIFQPDDAKETWTLQSKGILELKEV